MQTDFQPITIKFTDNKQSNLTEEEFKMMSFFQENEALAEDVGDVDVDLTSAQFEVIRRLLKDFKFKLPQPPKVKSNQLIDSLGQEMADYLGCFKDDELRSMYKAAHYLKIVNLCKCIAQHFACKVYMDPKECKEGYQKLMKDLNVKQPWGKKASTRFHKKFTFVGKSFN